jgi:hypothetical protein
MGRQGRPVTLSRRRALAALVGLALGLRPSPAGAQAVPPPPPRPAGPPAPAPPAAAPPAPAPPAAAPTPGGEPRPGVPAPPAVVEEIRAAIAQAVERLEARDAEGVLAYVSEDYWTGPLGKRSLRSQLLAILQVHQQLRARVQVDEVRLVGAHAWVWTTGDVTGQLAVVGQWVRLFVWQRELEVARREQGVWRLYGYQQ